MSEQTMGEAAYSAYGKATGGKNFRGEPMPAWSDLPAPIRAAWQDAAAAAIIFHEYWKKGHQ
jgi:hypothetical protein